MKEDFVLKQDFHEDDDSVNKLFPLVIYVLRYLKVYEQKYVDLTQSKYI